MKKNQPKAGAELDKHGRENPAFDFEFKFHQTLYEKLPNDKRVLSILAELYTIKGFYDKGLELDRKLLAMEPNDPTVRYNLACSLSLKLELSEAFEHLKESIRLGFNDWAWILEDPELSNLRQSEAFLAYRHEIGI